MSGEQHERNSSSEYGHSESSQRTISHTTDLAETEEAPFLPADTQAIGPKGSSTTGRHLSWQSVYILVISRVIGTGLFAAPGAIVQSSGSIGLSLIAWLIGAVIAACILTILLEYGCMFPQSGGEKVYLEQTYSHPKYLTSTIMIVRAVILGFTASNCIVFAQYVLFALDIEPTDWNKKLLAVGLLALVTIIHSCLPKHGVIIQNVLGWVKIALICFMIFAGLFVVIFRQATQEQPSSFQWNQLWNGSDWSAGAIAASVLKVNYAFEGLDNANFVLGEIKDPVKTIQSVSIAAYSSIFFLYILTNVAYFAVVPLDKIKSSGELIAALFFERSFGKSIGKVLLPLAVALSAASSVMVAIYSKARLNQELGRQGLLPYSKLLVSMEPFNAPMAGLLLHFVPSFLAIVLPPSEVSYSFVLEVGTYPKQFFVCAMSIGLLWLRYRRADLHRPFKAWISAALLMILISLSLIVAPLYPPRAYALVSIAILLGGVVYWYVSFVLLPKRMEYEIKEDLDISDDGVRTIRLVKVSTKLPSNE